MNIPLRILRYEWQFDQLLTCDADGKIEGTESVETVDGCTDNELDVTCGVYACELD